MDYLAGSKIRKCTNRKVATTNSTSNFNSRYSEFFDLLLKNVSLDEQVNLINKFLTNDIIEVMNDEELTECVNALIANNLNISETSRNTFLHRNTLLYRIEKIYKITGLNIRNFQDAEYFKTLNLIYNKVSKKLGNKNEYKKIGSNSKN